MVTCGIDASTSATGWSIFKDGELVGYGCIKPKGNDWRERIYHESPDLKEIFDKYKPEKIYMEDVPLKNQGGMSTLVKLGGVQMTIFNLAKDRQIDIEFVEPTSWRSRGGMYDGTREGTKREVMKQKAINMANEKFGLDLKWFGPTSKKSEDDTAEAIMICAIMSGVITKEPKFGKRISQLSQKSQSKK